MFTDTRPLELTDKLFVLPKRIIIHHTVDLLKRQTKGSQRFDTPEAAFPGLTKLAFQYYRYTRFFSQYLIEQLGEDYAIIVGTPENSISPFLNEFFPDYSEDILILVNGDYSAEIPPKELYIRLGQICTTVMQKNKIVGIGDVFLLENVKNPNKFPITPMKFFKKSELQRKIRV